jgi:hypothetical protein
MPTRLSDEDDDGSSNFLTKPAADSHYINQSGDIMNGDLNMQSNKLKNAELENCRITTTLSIDANIDMNSNKLVELGAPTRDRHAATKKYVDDLVATCLLSTGNLNVSGRRIQNVGVPTENTDAATKGYVDSRSQQMTTGWTVLTDEIKSLKAINMDNYGITNLGEPSAAQDAATKYYVDHSLRTFDVTNQILQVVPRIIPIAIDRTINRKHALVLVSDIELNVNTGQVVLIFNYHPYVKQIEKVLANAKLTITITLEHTAQIGRFILGGIVMIQETVNSGGTVSDQPSEAETRIRRELQQLEDNRALLSRQWAAMDTVRVPVTQHGGTRDWDQERYPREQLGGYNPASGGIPTGPRPVSGDTQEHRIQQLRRQLYAFEV